MCHLVFDTLQHIRKPIESGGGGTPDPFLVIAAILPVNSARKQNLLTSVKVYVFVNPNQKTDVWSFIGIYVFLMQLKRSNVLKF